MSKILDETRVLLALKAMEPDKFFKAQRESIENSPDSVSELVIDLIRDGVSANDFKKLSSSEKVKLAIKEYLTDVFQFYFINQDDRETLEFVFAGVLAFINFQITGKPYFMPFEAIEETKSKKWWEFWK